MRNPLPESCREGLHMIVLVSLIVLLRGVLVSTMFCMVHPYIHIHSMNDFCTCSTYVTVYAKTRHLSKIFNFRVFTGSLIVYHRYTVVANLKSIARSSPEI